MTGPGDELAELLWDHGPALRRPPFQPFSCSAAGSSSAQELKRHAADAAKAAFMGSAPLGMQMHDAAAGLGLPGLPVQEDDAEPPWLHCPVVDDGDGDTAPLPPEYCASLLSDYSGPETPAVPTARAVPVPPPEAAAKQAPAPSAEGVMNFTFFSRPLQRPQASPAAVESTVVQAATNRLRNTPLFSEQRMAWLQPPPKVPRTSVAVAAPQQPHPPLPQPHLTPPDHHHGVGEAATVTQTLHRLQPEARAPDAAAVTTSSVCSGNGDRSQAKRSSHHHQPTDCSVSQDELDLDDEGGAMRRSEARSSKRSRTAEVHNLSERRRRDRINEKMRALQELIPNCNKIDKASMLEEAIEYLKTLQLQVQMMSMGTGLCVPPMLLPAMAMPHPIPMAHAHFPHLGMGLGFGVGVGAAAFDMARVAAASVGAHFPCPPMAMPAPGAMFGVPGQQAMFAHMAAGGGTGTSPPEQTDAAAGDSAPAQRAAEHPPVPVTAQGDPKLQHP